MQFLPKAPPVNWSSVQQQTSPNRRERFPIRELGFEPTRWGYFPWCPQPIRELVHEFDVGIAQYFIPGPRILRLDRCEEDQEFQIASYGNLAFRIRPLMWRPVIFEGFQLGDLVEISRIHSPNYEACLATIEEVMWDSRLGRPIYRVSKQGTVLPRRFQSHQIRRRRRLESVQTNQSPFRIPPGQESLQTAQS